jgi:hypothetical protein
MENGKEEWFVLYDKNVMFFQDYVSAVIFAEMIREQGHDPVVGIKDVE